MKKTVYDKVEWHYPEGKGCPDLKTATIHFKAVLDWLDQHDLLTPLGKEIYDLGVDRETSITSDMLTEKGNRIMKRCYDEMTKGLKYGQTPSLDCFNGCLNR